ncbi:3-phosphoserine/phosphohydroxythreonine transaminase [Buchnera aphidicola (Formosaphis micheliae)]|uniref:3-phosphoserine/phosphohydroxythreonine transaminase n=1 Tax=Buchnera aphidicola TaxID=9 RepID=UPI0031B8597F
MKIIYNFSAGPAMLPVSVMKRVKEEFNNWKKLGISILEISHRSEQFMEHIYDIEMDLRELLNIPENYKVLFCHGGARGQFSAVPMNLLNTNSNPDYIDNGYWSHAAFVEAKKYCSPNLIKVQKIVNNNVYILPMHDWKISTKSSYIHYCPNETIEGIAINEEPFFNDKLIVGDFSSTILSRVINIKKYGIIYASAQKNIGVSGITLIIIRNDLLHTKNIVIPSILDYKKIAKHSSLFNTPSTFSWYVSGLVFKWLKNKGGVKNIQNINTVKANLLYNTIDKSNLYINNIDKNNRSYMNVTFKLSNYKLNKIFLEESLENGLYALKGHRIVGGFRASIYNAMSIKGVKKLIEFMVYFENKYG